MGSEHEQREVHYKDHVPEPDAGPAPRTMEANARDDHWWDERMNKDGKEGGHHGDE
jgi:hypothetical protein